MPAARRSGETGLDPDRIAAVVLDCPEVAGLHGGRFGEAATYLPGRRVTGVRATSTGVFVHLVGRYPTPLTDVDRSVRAALGPHLTGLALTITVEDYAAPGLPPEAPSTTGTTSAVPVPAAPVLIEESPL